MIKSIFLNNNKAKYQTMIWLIMAAAMLVLWLVLWLFSANSVKTKKIDTTQATADDFSLPATISNLNELSKVVPPLDFVTVVKDMRNYPAEFKDKAFFEKNKNRWTVQIMDVAQNDIITEYLKDRSDRDKFAYFRYKNSNNEQRYILTYGVMGSKQEAMGTIRTLDFGLPKTVTPVAEQMSNYLKMIDNYERNEDTFDYSEAAPRAVQLKETKKELPAEPAAEEPIFDEDIDAKIDEIAQFESDLTDAGPAAVQPDVRNQREMARQPEGMQQRADVEQEVRPQENRQQDNRRQDNRNADVNRAIDDLTSKQKPVEYGINPKPAEKPKPVDKSKSKAVNDTIADLEMAENSGN